MLDTLILHIPMQSEFVVKNGNLSSVRGDVATYQVKAVPLSFSRDFTGHVTVGDLRHPYESLPSSHGSMAMKFNAVNVANTDPYVSLNASVKFLQGHNIFGTSTVENLGKEMLAQLALHYPALFSCLDISRVSISRVDSTYSAVLPNMALIQPALRYLANVSNGHRKNDTRRDFYNTTYFGGKNSRNGGAKIYGKGHEVQEYVKKLAIRAKTDARAATQLAVYTPEIIKYSENLLRLESSTKRRKLESLNIPDNFWDFIVYEKNNPDVLHLLWSHWFQPILDTLKGSIVSKVDDDDVLELLKESLFGYQGVKLTKKRKFVYHRPPRPAHLHLPLKEHDKYYGKKDYQVRAVPKRIYTKAYNAYNFYQLIRLNGYENVKARSGRRAFDIKVKTLAVAGISKSDLQNLHLKDDDSYDIATLITDSIDFDNQVPFGFITPISSHIDSFDSDLGRSFIPVSALPSEYDPDSGVLSKDELDKEYSLLKSMNNYSFDNTLASADIDLTPIDASNSSPVLTVGQLKRMVIK